MIYQRDKSIYKHVVAHQLTVNENAYCTSVSNTWKVSNETNITVQCTQI